MGLPRRLVVVLVLAAISAMLGVAVAVGVFLSSSRTIVLAGHDSVVRGTLTGDAVLRTGPLLPDFRVREVGPIGVNVDVGKTEAGSLEELLERYAFIASQPEPQVAKVTDALWELAVRGLLAGLGVALLPVAIWLLLGAHRRGELFRAARTPRGALGAAFLVALPVLVWQPWWGEEETQRETGRWQSLGAYVGESVPLPAEVRQLEILTGPTTTQTKRLVLSAVDTYEKSKSFYRTASLDAAELEVRPAGPGETVALLVSDRHDNIGMDGVARAIGEAAGASVVLGGGDDTSTGQPWEAFSLDSLDETFGDWERFGVAGNHDHGGFVSRTLAAKGWTMLEGEPVDAPWGGTVIGVDDPRSSGLGSWRDETGLTFDEMRDRLAVAACDAEERVSLMLVHDANLGREALERGCVDLVVGGHTHVQNGPDPVAGTGGSIGYTWTNGTTGGAAYAIAIGSKPRRDAEVSLITFSDGRPVGLQWVRLRTDGSFRVGEWTPIYPG